MEQIQQKTQLRTLSGVSGTPCLWSGDILPLDPRRDAAPQCPWEKGPQVQKEVGDPWGCRGHQVEVSRLVTLSACRGIPCVFRNIPVSPRLGSSYTPQQSIIGKARLCKFRIEAQLSHENQKALLPPAKVIARSKQQVRKQKRSPAIPGQEVREARLPARGGPGARAGQGCSMLSRPLELLHNPAWLLAGWDTHVCRLCCVLW